MSWLAGLEHVVREQELLAPWNWLRIGGQAEFFAEPTSVQELRALLQRSQESGIPVRMLGAGANVLIPDEGVRGLVIHLSAPAFCSISTRTNDIVAGGGARLSHVVATAAREGLVGLEPLVGVPGTVGGALRGNASGHGASIGQWTSSVAALDMAGNDVNLAVDDLRFRYQESNLDQLVVLEAVFTLENGDSAVVTRQMQKLWIVKRASQPTGDYGHAQVFANPRGMTAGEIIEQAGLKGVSVGEAMVSERDANFIEVKPNATSEDVRKLIDHVRAQVSSTLGVELVPKIDIW